MSKELNNNFVSFSYDSFFLDLPFNHQEISFENAFFVGNITVKEDDEKR